MGAVFDLLGALVAVIVEALVKFFTSAGFTKAMVAALVYAFLFAIVPLLINALVPSSLMQSFDGLAQMLSGGPTSVSCSGSTPVNLSTGTSVSCSGSISIVAIGQGIAYLLGFFQVQAAFGCILPALAVRFLFKRI